MKQAVNILIKENKRIRDIRKKYLLEYKKYKFHITLVYPFEIKNQEQLIEHINKSAKRIKPFNLILSGLKKSAREYYLYLLIKEGKKEIMVLYKNLNRGVLKGFQNKNLPRYIPHVTLGGFRSKKEIDKVINSLKNQKISLSARINSIQLLTLNKDMSIKSIKNFKLK